MGISIGFLGWVVPFIFVLHPELNFEGSPAAIGIIFLLMLIGLVGLTFGLGGFTNRQLSLWERALFLIAAGAIFAYWNIPLTLAAVALMGILLFGPVILKRRNQT
jgi:TRAP-type uncharacterized transport system fused permease subunit